VDGGAALNDWLMRFQAGVVGLPVRRPGLVETTALGAAVLAALGGGLVEDLATASRMWGVEQEFLPSMEPSRREHFLTGWRRAVERSLR